MKRRLDLDFTAEREGVADLIDTWHARQAAHRFKLAPIHAAKARVARMAGDQPTLTREAKERGISSTELRCLILAREAEQHAAILALDEQRLMAKRELAAAETWQAIDAIRARYINP